MIKCNICGKQFGNTQGLSGHLRFVHQQASNTRSNTGVLLSNTRSNTGSMLDGLDSVMNSVDKITGIVEKTDKLKTLGKFLEETANIKQEFTKDKYWGLLGMVAVAGIFFGYWIGYEDCRRVNKYRRY